MKLHFGYVLGVGALAIATCAAFFSVYGLSKLFSGASIAVIVMASSLEIGKLIAASYLQRYWSEIPKLMRVYVTLGVITLVGITSAGIYGFLSSAYKETANEYAIVQGDIGILKNKITNYESKKGSNDVLIESKNKRSEQLTSLRTSQEIRLDSLIKNEHWYNVNQTRKDINKASADIDLISTDIERLLVDNSAYNDSINKYNAEILQLENSSTSTTELGPIEYISDLTGMEMDMVVNYFIFLLIFVFDPLAITLVVATNWVFEKERKKLELKELKDSSNKDKDLDPEPFNDTEPTPPTANTTELEVKTEDIKPTTENNKTEIIEVLKDMGVTTENIIEIEKPEEVTKNEPHVNHKLNVTKEITEEFEPEIESNTDSDPEPIPNLFPGPITVEETKEGSEPISTKTKKKGNKHVLVKKSHEAKQKSSQITHVRDGFTQDVPIRKK